jgi:hypothetical protein
VSVFFFFFFFEVNGKKLQGIKKKEIGKKKRKRKRKRSDPVNLGQKTKRRHYKVVFETRQEANPATTKKLRFSVL